MTIWRSVAEGGTVPKGYGIAWFELLDGRAWCLPLPLNLIAGLCRRIYHWAITRTQPSVIDRARLQGYRAGRWRTMRYVDDLADRRVEQFLRVSRYANEAEQK